ncbi:FAD-binding protein [Streptomyces triticagri]|uniref:FAD-binding protein n=1 Tax=Streptomyces triticagri TaxID=2293568 RepID=A0A372M8D5_9ACTN|nr:FAD/NAD(P)-binding protein [Streptomyces triticagri]RFU86775.1 FAD-binding protein [Streptomyces triticagri]
MNSGHARTAIVGAGPRGISVLERICSQERKSATHEALTVHLVDPWPPGAGQVWRTSQSPHLLMNTVASQVTLYTDASVTIDGPIAEGPSLYEWARRLAAAGDGGLGAEVLAEARRLGPDSYPTRAFYGHYLRRVCAELIREAPAHVRVEVHTARAVALTEEEPGGPQSLHLADGSLLTGLDAVVLAQGHLPAAPGRAEERLARFAERHRLTYIPPANPADVQLASIRPGERVLLRGLGLNFFDYLALFTAGRGGRFERTADGRLTYHPSGREPLLLAGSRRGVPYHARGENEKGPHGRYEPRLLTTDTVARLRQSVRDGEWLHFGTDLWPLIQKEVQGVYYAALLARRDGRATAEHFALRHPSAATPEDEELLLAEYGIGADERWDWDALHRPYGDREFTSAADYNDWLLGHLRRDAAEARAGNVSGPLKAALDVLRDLRNEIRLAVDHGGLEANSHRDDLEGWYSPLNAFLSIGPPVSRTEELIALAEAGVVSFTGPGMRIGTTETGPAGGEFTASSDHIEEPPVTARVLIEARLPEPDLRRTTDPLLVQLRQSGQCRPYVLRGTCGSTYETGGLDVTERPYRLVDAEGRPHPRRFAYGVPTESVHWLTAAGIRPGVGSVTLEDSDAIALAVRSVPVPAGVSA